jgi:hypothetical protein
MKFTKPLKKKETKVSKNTYESINNFLYAEDARIKAMEGNPSYVISQSSSNSETSKLPTERPMAGKDDRFRQILLEMLELHDRKQSDYGRTEDPFSNVRASEDYGIPGWIGSLIRANDKNRRLQKAASGSTMTNESIEDSLIDGANYYVIALILYREWLAKQPKAACKCGGNCKCGKS